jgi:hypothetical protein
MANFGVASYDQRHNQLFEQALIFWTSNIPIWGMKLKAYPKEPRWLGRAAHGYEPTREAAMAAFAKSWRQS